MKLYKKIMSAIASVEKIVISVVLVFVTVITFANVVVRKLTTRQFAWSEELVINLFVLLIMLGCALAAQEGSLISLSLIYDRLQTGAKKVLSPSSACSTWSSGACSSKPASRRSSTRWTPASTPPP